MKTWSQQSAEILLEISLKNTCKLTMDNEIKYLKRNISDIKKKLEGIDELKAGQARLEAHMEGMSEQVKAADQKAEKTESRLWYIVIAVIIAGGIPSSITKLLG